MLCVLLETGVAHAWFLGTLAFSAFGLGGYFLVCLYFVLGTAVTKVKVRAARYNQLYMKLLIAKHYVYSLGRVIENELFAIYQFPVCKYLIKTVFIRLLKCCRPIMPL